MGATFRYALKKSAPVFCGYLFLGIAFAVTMCDAGFAPGWAILSSIIIYAGSMQFAMVHLLSAGTGLGTLAVMTLLINSRHIFYGLSFVEVFQKMKGVCPYMIFSLSDETYAVLCAAKEQPGVDLRRARFYVALLDQSYWVLGTAVGALLGSIIPFDTEGIDFSMTALFLTIFVDQWKGSKSHAPALTALCAGILFLLLLGPERFLLPAIAAAVCVLLLAGGRIRRAEADEPAREGGAASEG